MNFYDSVKLVIKCCRLTAVRWKTLGHHRVLYLSELHFSKCLMFSLIYRLFITSYIDKIKEMETLFCLIRPKASFAEWLWASCFQFLAICKSKITQMTPIFLQHCSRLRHMTFENLPLISVHFYEQGNIMHYDLFCAFPE